MNKVKLVYGSIIVMILTTSLYSLQFSNKEESIYKDKNIEDIISLIHINKSILAMTHNTNMDLIDNNPIFEDKELESEDIYTSFNEIKEDKEIIISQNTEKNISTPSRGTTTTENRSEKINGFNKYVLDVINTYPLGTNNYPYLLNNDFQNYNGVTENLYYQGEILLKGHPSGTKYSHCTGITFEVFFKAMKKRNKDLAISEENFNGMNNDELFDFVLTWYVANGPKSMSNLAEALEKYGLGKRITNLEELRQGDFMDFSRENNTGHAVVFMNWIKEGNKIIGFKYWSSQQSTNGIGYKEEYFNVYDSNGRKYGNVMIDNLHMARVNP